ncbi:MAG: hypothetical protein ABR575_03060 [Actinomycetota bacterium]
MAAALSAVVLASCSEDRLSKADFIARADEICKEADAKTRDLTRPSTAPEVDSFVEAAGDITRDAVARIRSLKPPEQDEAAIAEMLSKVEEALEHLPEMSEAAKDQDLDAMQAAGRELTEAAEDAQTIAAEYGFEVCGGVAPTGTPPTP